MNNYFDPPISLRVSRKFVPVLILLLIFASNLHGQDSEINRRVKDELKMNFPSIYFKHNSTEYAEMPYSVDSCFKYIAFHIKDVSDFVIWRDSSETERLSQSRVKKVRAELNKHKPKGAINVESMGREQKLCRRTIEMGVDSAQIHYLLSVNSVFEIAKTRFLKNKREERKHMKISQIGSWFDGPSLRQKLRKSGKPERPLREPEKKDKKKKRRRLVWTGWKTGFHFSTSRNTN